MKKIALFLSVLLLVGLLYLPATAQEYTFEYLETSKDVVIYVSWSVEQPAVTFLAPDGTVYDPMAETENTVTTVGENELYYIIYQAPAGQWSVELDKKGNPTVDIAMFDYQDALSIESFTLGTPEDDSLPVTFYVSSRETRSYSYKISAAIQQGGEERELKSGSARSNQEQSLNVDLRSLASYDAYLLKLYVCYTDNGTDFFDQTYSKPFSYTNTSVTSPLTDFVFAIDPDASLAYVSWGELDYSAEAVMVALFEGDADEPAFFDTYDPKSQTVQLAYDPAVSKVSAEFSVNVNGVYTDVLHKTAELSSCPLTLENTEATNKDRLSLDYVNLNKANVQVTVNGISNDLILDGTDSVSVLLEDDWNQVLVEYTDSQGITWHLERKVFVDRIPPVLSMSENYDRLVTGDTSITISGSVRDGTSVCVNGAEVTLSADGSFSYSLALNSGENELAVTAYDSLGNEGRYSATIISTSGGYQLPLDSASANAGNGSGTQGVLASLFAENSLLWMLIAIVLCLLVVLYALIFWRKKGQTGGNRHE